MHLCIFSIEFLYRTGKNVLRSAVSFVTFMTFLLSPFLSQSWLMLNFNNYECNGICAENTYKPGTWEKCVEN
jgi:hypothetical protein